MTHIKKSLSVVLALLMLISLFAVAPITANAAETNIQEVGATYSGTTGDCTWNLNTTTGLLSISGTGAMGDYSWSTDVPWYSYRSYVKTVTISSGVTSIGGCAFSWCTNLTSITIPSSVTSIGYQAFYCCTSLTSITIPSSVTNIGNYVFSGCTSLISIYVNINNTKYSSVNGNLYNKDKTTLIQYAIGKTDTSFTIPSGVTSIGDSAFYNCTSLKSVIIPNSVTSIGREAFYNCTSIMGVTIPSSVTSIGDSVFNNCARLTSITILGSITSIGNFAFSRCTSLTSVTIPSSVTSIGREAFFSCSSLTSVTIPSSVTSIGESAFADCTSLTSIDVDRNNENYSSINGNLYNKDKTTLIQYALGKTAASFTIPSSVTNIGNYVFSGCTSLNSVTILGSVTNIGYYAFSRCISLTSITIPSSVTSIGNYAFFTCTSLNQVYYTGTESDWNSISIGSYNTSLTNATIYYSTQEYDYSINNNQIITVSAGDTYKYIAFIPEETGEYFIYSSGSYDTYGNISDYSGTDIDFDDDSGVDYNFSMTVNLTEGELYLIGAKLYDSDDIGSFTVTVTDGTEPIVTEPTETTEPSSETEPTEESTETDPVDTEASSETEPTEISYETILLNESKTVNISTAGAVKYYQFTPEYSGTYQIYSSGDCDTYGYLYDSNMNQLFCDDDGGSEDNFKISYNLTAGTKYIIGAKLYNSSRTGSFTVTVTDGTGQIVTEPTETTVATVETQPTQPITNPTVPILPTQPVTEPTMIFTQSTVPTADIKPTETEPTTEETVPQPTETVPQPTETVPVETQPTQPSETEPTECVHANTITVGAKAATYFAKGYTGSKICTDCGEVVSYGRTVDMKVLKTPKVTVKGAKKAIKVTYSKVKDAKGFTVTYKLGKKTYTKKFTLSKSELKKAKVTKTIKVNKAGSYKVTVKAFTTSGKKTAYSKATSTKTAKVK